MKKRQFAIFVLVVGSLALTACSNMTVDASVPSEESSYVIELDPEYNVPTEELLEAFPITYQTPADTEMEIKIQNRMLNGFNRWNMGYEAWEHWGEVLYYEDLSS